MERKSIDTAKECETVGTDVAYKLTVSESNSGLPKPPSFELLEILSVAAIFKQMEAKGIILTKENFEAEILKASEEAANRVTELDKEERREEDLMNMEKGDFVWVK